VLQRKCDCGQHTGGGECEECKKKKVMLQRHSNGTGSPAVAPPIVREVLQSPGQPLDQQTRSAMESRFGAQPNIRSRASQSAGQIGELQIDSPESPWESEADRTADAVLSQPASSEFRRDFSAIRVHTDDRAGEAARAVNAQAFAVGEDLVFAAGRYAPGNRNGRRLLAHELSHTLQQHSGQRLRRTLAVDPNLAPGAPPTDPSAGLTSAARFSMMDTLIQKLCPKFHVNSSGVVESTTLQSFSPDSLAAGAHGTGCCCLNILVEAPTPWKIEVSSIIGAQTRSSQVFLNPTNTPVEFGAFTASNKLAFQGAVPTAGHELCGHAALEEVKAHPIDTAVGAGTDRLNKDLHDPTVRIENRISTEQGVPPAQLRGLAASGSHRGESVDKITIEKFPFNETEIPASEKSKVKFAAQYIFTPGEQDEYVSILGHSDSVGSASAKKAVSEGRAQKVKKALDDAGVPATISKFGLPTTNRFRKVEGVSDSQPPAPPLDANPENWRRAEILMAGFPAGTLAPPAATPTGVAPHTQSPNVPAQKGSPDACIKKLVNEAYP
jgi:outer membrane protein OmpA-like peptidoglycan-associated protein